MKSGLGSVLLIAGTVCGSLAAASNERAWRRVPLDRVALGDPSVVLFADVPVDADAGLEEVPPAEAGAVEPEPIARAGEPVSAAAVDALRARGADTVRVRRMARSDEEVPVGPELEGRILAEAVYVDAASEEVLTRAEAGARIALAEAARVVLDAPGAPSSVPLVRGEDGVWRAADGDGAIEPDRTVTAAELAPLADDARLAGLPPMRTLAPADRYVDAELAAALTEGGLERVRVNIPKPKFSFGTWPGLIPFVLSVLAMVAGVVLMRSGRREALSAADERAAADDTLSPAERLATIVAGVRALAGAADDLGCEDFLERIEPLLSVEAVAFVEARDRLRLSLGGRDFAAVMAPFATGERRLSRAWSAAADGHVQEARASIAEAVEPLELALETLARLSGTDGDDPAVETHTGAAEAAEDTTETPR